MAKIRLKTEKIFSLDIVSSPQSQLIAYLSKAIAADKRLFVVTPNPEFIIASKKDPLFLAILKKADIAVCDAIGLIWAREVMKVNGFFRRFCQGFLVGLKVLKGELSDQIISGTDLMVDLCQMAAQNGWPVYLLGGQPGVGKKALAVLKKRFPGLDGWAVSGPRHPRGEEEKSDHLRGGRVDPPASGGTSDSSEVNGWSKWVKKINQKKPTLLFVALGMKKQEQFIWQNLSRLKIQVAMGVGGAFDYLSGNVKRAPYAWRRLGLEWLYRLINQPWRFKRQLTLLKFIWMVLGEK